MNIRRYRKSILPLIPAVVLFIGWVLPGAAITEEDAIEWYNQLEVWLGAGVALFGPLISYIVPNDGTT